MLVPTCYELPRTSLCIYRETYADLMWASIIHQRYPRQPLARAGLALSDRGGAVERLVQNFWRLPDLSPACGVGHVISSSWNVLEVFGCSSRH